MFILYFPIYLDLYEFEIEEDDTKKSRNVKHSKYFDSILLYSKFQ